MPLFAALNATWENPPDGQPGHDWAALTAEDVAVAMEALFRTLAVPMDIMCLSEDAGEEHVGRVLEDTAHHGRGRPEAIGRHHHQPLKEVARV